MCYKRGHPISYSHINISHHSSKLSLHSNTANPIAAAPTTAPAAAIGRPAAPLPAVLVPPLALFAALAAPEALLCTALALLDPDSNTLLALALALASAELATPVILLLSVFVPLRIVLAVERIELADAPAAEVMLFAPVDAALREEARALREERPDWAAPVPAEAERRVFWARVAAGATRRRVDETFIVIGLGWDAVLTRCLRCGTLGVVVGLDDRITAW